MNMLRPAAAIALGVSLVGAGIGLVFMLMKQDETLALTFDETRRQRRTLEVSIPTDQVGILIGRSGKNIKEIQDKSGARITFKDENPAEPFRICVIRGLPDKVQQAETLIHEFLAAQPKLETLEMIVPQAVCGRIIGRSGTSIRLIQKTSGAKVNLNDDPTLTDERRIVIRGTETQVALAKSLIEGKVQEDEEVRRSLEQCHRTPRSPSRQLCIAAGNLAASRREQRSMERLSAQEGYIDVYLSAMKNPGRFWLQLAGQPSVSLDKLTETMTEFYNDEQNSILYKPKDLLEPGETVAAQLEALGDKWYRAKVLEVSEDEYDKEESLVEFYFVDFGDDAQQRQKQLRKLNLDFLKSLRYQAIECSLAGVAPIDGSWSSEAADDFDELGSVSQWEIVQVKTMGYSQSTHGFRATSPVPLVDVVNGQGKNLAEEMVSRGHAVKISEQGSKPATNGTSSPAQPERRPPAVCVPAGEEEWDVDSDDDLELT